MLSSYLVPPLLSSQLAYAAVSVTQREEINERGKEGALIAGGALSQKKTTARKHVPLLISFLNKTKPVKRLEKKVPPLPITARFV